MINEQGQVRRVIVEAKPTWSLAWGLMWRMMLVQGLIGAVVYGLVLVFASV